MSYTNTKHPYEPTRINAEVNMMNSAIIGTVYEHRLNLRAKKVFTGSTDVTEPAAKKSYHWLIRRNGLNRVGSTGDSAPDDPTKSNCNAGVVVQSDLKMDELNTG